MSDVNQPRSLSLAPAGKSDVFKGGFGQRVVKHCDIILPKKKTVKLEDSRSPTNLHRCSWKALSNSTSKSSHLSFRTSPN